MVWTRNQPMLTMGAAQALLDAGVAHAIEEGIAVSITVLDPAGRLLAFLRMDGAPHVSIEASLKKARTAVGFGIPTGQAWLDFVSGDPILEGGVGHLPDFILLGGGSPVRLADQLVGALGVSGGHYSQDERIAAAALRGLDS